MGGFTIPDAGQRRVIIESETHPDPSDGGLDYTLERLLESTTERHGDEDLVLRLIPHERFKIGLRVQTTSWQVGITYSRPRRPFHTANSTRGLFPV